MTRNRNASLVAAAALILSSPSVSWADIASSQLDQVSFCLDTNGDPREDSGGDRWVDGGSDDKGPEPESITTGEIGGELYAFIGLERTRGIFIYKISNPSKPIPVGFMDI